MLALWLYFLKPQNKPHKDTALHPTWRLLWVFLKLNEIGRLEDDGIWSQLRGQQAGRDRCTQEVHRGVVGQAEKLLLWLTGPWTEKAGRDSAQDSSLPQVCA